MRDCQPKWQEYVERMNDQWIPKTVFKCNPAGKRSWKNTKEMKKLFFKCDQSLIIISYNHSVLKYSTVGVITGLIHDDNNGGGGDNDSNFCHCQALVSWSLSDSTNCRGIILHLTSVSNISLPLKSSPQSTGQSDNSQHTIPSKYYFYGQGDCKHACFCFCHNGKRDLQAYKHAFPKTKE